MDLHQSLARLAGHPRLRPRTVRLRLTLLYGGLFLVSGAGLLAITNVAGPPQHERRHLQRARRRVDCRHQGADHGNPVPPSARSGRSSVPVGRPHPLAAPAAAAHTRRAAPTRDSIGHCAVRNGGSYR